MKLTATVIAALAATVMIAPANAAPMPHIGSPQTTPSQVQAPAMTLPDPPPPASVRDGHEDTIEVHGVDDD